MAGYMIWRMVCWNRFTGW